MILDLLVAITIEFHLVLVFTGNAEHPLERA
jgi:hypothetical protein